MFCPPTLHQLTKAVAIGTVAAAFAAGVTFTQPVQAADGLAAGTLAHFVGYEEPARFKAMEAALGRPIDRVVTMNGHQTPAAMRSSVWGQFASPSAYLPALSNRLDVTVTIPLAFGEQGLYAKVGPQANLKQLQQTSSGAHDADYRIVARNLIDAGYSDAVIRLGHEFDGVWVPWSARDNEQGYIEAFRHVHDVFAQESSAFTFEWTGMNAPWVAHAKGAYPGDAYVDIIGLDIYYRSPEEISDSVWNQYKATLTDHRNFAISKGKPVSYPEWGRAKGDTPRFVDLMFNWFSDLPKSGPGKLAYQSYFNPTHQGGEYDLNNQPNVKRRYLQLFSTSGGTVPPPTTVPPTTVPPTTVPPTTVPPTTVPPTTVPPTTVPPTTVPPTTVAPTPTTAPKAASIVVRPRVAALELTWFYPGDEMRNVRYRTVNSKTWTWPGNGAWNQVIPGLRSGTRYEVQVRAFANGAWQPWMSATATTK